jgi:hypothetical protein
MLKEVARRLKNWHSARRLAEKIGINICEHSYDKSTCTQCMETMAFSEVVPDNPSEDDGSKSSLQKFYFFSPFELLSGFLSDKYILDDNINLELRQRHVPAKDPAVDDESSEGSTETASTSSKELNLNFLVNVPIQSAV